MAPVFHWVRVKVVCYATENEEILHEMMTALTGLEELDIDITEGLHGNPIIVIDASLSHNREYDKLFKTLGKDVISEIASELDARIDDDCVIYARLDKQKAVKGEYAISHSGDVISITGKVASHPARKEIAVKNAEAYFRQILQSYSDPSSESPEQA